MSYKTAKDFWKYVDYYPDYPNTDVRRQIDIDFVSSRVENVKSVLDLGCADGHLLLALRSFIQIEKFYGYDISPGLLKVLRTSWGNRVGLKTNLCDFTKQIKYPNTDLTIAMGLFIYIFDYFDLYNILDSVKSQKLIIRIPCTMKNQDEYINTYSKDLSANYSAVYRTTQNYLDILKIFYANVHMKRAYPDEIESKYGTKHFFFVCERR